MTLKVPGADDHANKLRRFQALGSVSQGLHQTGEHKTTTTTTTTTTIFYFIAFSFSATKAFASHHFLTCCR